jgi:hypothetical protein
MKNCSVAEVFRILKSNEGRRTITIKNSGAEFTGILKTVRTRDCYIGKMNIAIYPGTKASLHNGFIRLYLPNGKEIDLCFHPYREEITA